MKQKDGHITRLVLAGAVVAILLGNGGTADADFVFGEPTNLELPVNSVSLNEGSTLSPDGLSLFFGLLQPDAGDWDLYVATRETTNDPWSPAVNLGPTVNTPQAEGYPSISADGLMLYFSSDRHGGSGGCDLWVTTRTTTNDEWSTPVNLGPVVNSASFDAIPSISCDNQILFFESNRPGGFGSTDIWMARWCTISGTWGEPINLGAPVNSPSNEGRVSIAPDGSAIYFHSTRPGGYGGWGLYQLPILPVVDLNCDGIVDAMDMGIVVDHWGTDEPLCDIGPMPWGDGIVDVQDLIVLAKHLFEEFPPAQ